MSLVVGIDSSTQAVKVVVCDVGTGTVLRSERAQHPEGTEVDADAWWRAFLHAASDPGLLSGVQAIAVGGQQHGMVSLDQDNRLVRDALLWNDNRSGSDAADLVTELGRDVWARQVGSVPVAAMTVSKLRWLARVEPEHASRTAAVVLPHDYLTWRLGDGSFGPVTDRGDASGTGYFDAGEDAYRTDLVRHALGHDLSLPRVAGPNEIIGHTPDGVVLAPGTGDNMAAGLALDVRPGEAVVSLGTSGTAYTVAGQQTQERSGTVCGFADATGQFLPLVCTLNCARNLEATARLLGVGWDEFSRLAMTASPGAGGLVFMPYLEGERTPPLPMATGELTGITLANLTPANLARAAIESILQSLAYGIDALTEHTGPIETITLTGGAAQSSAVQRIAAAVFGRPITVTEPFEAVAVGAARQAAWALTGELPAWSVPVQRRFEPVAEDVAAHRNSTERFRELLHTHYRSETS